MQANLAGSTSGSTFTSVACDTGAVHTDLAIVASIRANRFVNAFAVDANTGFAGHCFGALFRIRGQTEAVDADFLFAAFGIACRTRDTNVYDADFVVSTRGSAFSGRRDALSIEAFFAVFTFRITFGNVIRIGNAIAVFADCALCTSRITCFGCIRDATAVFADCAFCTSRNTCFGVVWDAFAIFASRALCTRCFACFGVVRDAFALFTGLARFAFGDAFIFADTGTVDVLLVVSAFFLASVVLADFIALTCGIAVIGRLCVD